MLGGGDRVMGTQAELGPLRAPRLLGIAEGIEGMSDQISVSTWLTLSQCSQRIRDLAKEHRADMSRMAHAADVEGQAAIAVLASGGRLIGGKWKVGIAVTECGQSRLITFKPLDETPPQRAAVSATSYGELPAPARISASRKVAIRMATAFR